jgi:hypothetical protein
MKSRGKLTQEDDVPDSAILSGWKITCIGIDPFYTVVRAPRSASLQDLS